MIFNKFTIGDILVRPEDFIKDNYSNEVDFAILDHLYTIRNCGSCSACELTSALQNHYFCKNAHVFTLPIGMKQECPICDEKAIRLINQRQDHAERTVRNRLSKLYSQGDVQKMVRDPTGERGRSPEVYRSSETFNTRLEDYLNRKEMKIGYQASMHLRKETEDDRQRLAAAGIVHCPSCGDPVPKSDLIRISGAEIDSCLTEYMHAALNNTIIDGPHNGSFRETVKDQPELTATGFTVDQSRENLFNAIIDWVKIRQKEGLDIPPLGVKP